MEHGSATSAKSSAPQAVQPRHLQARAATPWVPVRSLAARHRPRITTHLQALSAADRYLRFGQVVSDEQIATYVGHLDFGRDEVFGIFNRRLALIALAHLAYEPPHAQIDDLPTMAEFGVSVLAEARGRGYGRRLFEHAVIHARNRGTDKLFIHALSENSAMLAIARHAGATVQSRGSESQAWLALPPETLGSQLEQLVDTQAAELNYRLKQHALRIEQLIDAVGAIRRGLVQAGSAISQ